MKSTTVRRFALLLFLLFMVWFSYDMLKPPEPKPASTSSTEFSAVRAFEHVKQIAQAPRPLGSSANDDARNYIMEQLQGFGLEPFIQKGVGIGSLSDHGILGYPKNIIAKIEGQDPEKTILLMAHYDTVPIGPGAADDASGTAAILETVRAIQSRNTPLKNNIWVLLTDGEERGLLGAELFADEFEELEQIDLVMNFEARGTSGPSLMFETSSPNNKLIPHFAKATQNPVANSLMYTVYKLMPNNTDLTVFKQAGLYCLNFAITEDFLNYHTMQDNPENLSLASLQHHGTNMMDNVLYFGNTDFDLKSGSESVFFNDVTGGLVYYPSSWSFPLALVTALLFLVYLIYLFRTCRLTIGSYFGSVLLYVGMIFIGALVTYFGWQFFKLFNPQYQWLIHRETYNHTWYLWGFSFLITALFLGVYGFNRIRKKLSVEKYLTGPFTFWILLMLSTAWYLPTASFVFTWPVLLALVGWMVLGEKIIDSSWKSTGILALSLLGVLFLIPPYIYLVQVMLTTELLAVSMVILILLLGLTWPMVWQIIQPRKIIWNSGLAVAALVCFLIASTDSEFDSNQKKQNDMNYVQNIDNGQAYWFSRDFTTDTWTQQFLGTNHQKGTPTGIRIFERSNLLYSNAGTYKLTPPTYEILSDNRSDSLRHLMLRINSREDGIGLHMDWEDSAIAGITLDGKEIYNASSMDDLTYFKDLSDPVDIGLILRNGRNPTLYFTFIGLGLPTHLISGYTERSPHMMPRPRMISNTSLWQTQVNLDTLRSIQSSTY